MEINQPKQPAKKTVEQMLVSCGGFAKLGAKAFISNITAEENNAMAAAANDDGSVDIVKFTKALNGVRNRLAEAKAATSEPGEE